MATGWLLPAVTFLAVFEVVLGLVPVARALAPAACCAVGLGVARGGVLRVLLPPWNGFGGGGAAAGWGERWIRARR